MHTWKLVVACLALGAWGCAETADDAPTPDAAVDMEIRVLADVGAPDAGADAASDMGGEPDAALETDGELPDAALQTACSDGVDNDRDGKVDFPDDPGCADASDDVAGALNWARQLWCDMIVEPVETRAVIAQLLDVAGRTPAKTTDYAVFRM